MRKLSGSPLRALALALGCAASAAASDARALDAAAIGASVGAIGDAYGAYGAAFAAHGVDGEIVADYAGAGEAALDGLLDDLGVATPLHRRVLRRHLLRVARNGPAPRPGAARVFGGCAAPSKMSSMRFSLR